MAEARPWSHGEKWLVGLSVAGVVAVGLFAWHVADRDPDTSGDCPNVEAALKKFEKQASRDPEKTAVALDDAIRGWFCANPTGDATQLRAFLYDVGRRAVRKRRFGFLDELLHSRFPSGGHPRESPDVEPPEARKGSEAQRAKDYIREAHDRDIPWAVFFGRDRLVLGAETAVVAAMQVHQVWWRAAGRWRRASFAAGCLGGPPVFIDPAAGAVALTCPDADYDIRVFDALRPADPPIDLGKASEVTFNDDGSFHFIRPYDPRTPLGADEILLEYGWRLTREGGALRSSEVLVSTARKALYDLLRAPAAERRHATESDDDAEALARIARADVREEREPDEEIAPRVPGKTLFSWRCDDLCGGAGGCTIELDETPSGPHVTFTDLPPGCETTDLAKSPDPARFPAPPNVRILALRLPEPVDIVPDDHGWLVLANERLQKIPKTGGRFELVATGSRDAYATCDGSRRLVATPKGALVRLDHLARVWPADRVLDDGAVDIAADAKFAYVLRQGNLEAHPYAGGGPLLFTANRGDATTLTLAQYTGWILSVDDEEGSTRLTQVPLVIGGSPRLVDKWDDARATGPLRTDERGLFWAFDDGRLMRYDLITAATIEVVPAGAAIDAFALGADDVFYATADGEIRRVPKTGGKSTVYATGQRTVCSLAVSADSLAWESGGTLASAPLKGPVITVAPGPAPAEDAGE